MQAPLECFVELDISCCQTGEETRNLFPLDSIGLWLDHLEAGKSSGLIRCSIKHLIKVSIRFYLVFP